MPLCNSVWDCKQPALAPSHGLALATLVDVRVENLGATEQTRAAPVVDPRGADLATAPAHSTDPTNATDSTDSADPTNATDSTDSADSTNSTDSSDTADSTDGPVTAEAAEWAPLAGHAWGESGWDGMGVLIASNDFNN